MNDNVVSVLVVEDEHLVADLMGHHLKSLTSIHLVGLAHSGREALALLGKVRIDVILADVAMPEMDGEQLTRAVARSYPDVRVIAVTVSDTPDCVHRMFSAGARGYVMKSELAEVLAEAIGAVAAGKLYISMALRRELGLGQPFPLEKPGKSRQRILQACRRQALPPRQREVVQLIAEGHTTEAIADLLGVKLGTVAKYREELMSKLGLHSVADVTRYAIRNGLTPRNSAKKRHSHR